MFREVLSCATDLVYFDLQYRASEEKSTPALLMANFRLPSRLGTIQLVSKDPSQSGFSISVP